GDGGAVAGQLPVFSSFICGSDAEAAASCGAAGVCAGYVDQSKQPCAGWWASDFRDGKRSGCGDRRHVWVEEVSWTPMRRRNDGESRGPVGCRATTSGKEDSRQ